MKVLIVGGGKIGFYLAKSLIEHDHETVLVERNKELCKRAANELDIPVINGDGSSIEILELAECGETDVFVAVTGFDEVNLVSCQLAKTCFNVKKTIARVNNPKNKNIMAKLGIDIPMSTTDHIAGLINHEVDSPIIKHLLDTAGGDISINEFTISAKFKAKGRKLSEMNLPENFVISLIDRGGTVIIPKGNTELFPGDKIISVSHSSALHEINRIFCEI